MAVFMKGKTNVKFLLACLIITKKIQFISPQPIENSKIYDGGITGGFQYICILSAKSPKSLKRFALLPKIRKTKICVGIKSSSECKS